MTDVQQYEPEEINRTTSVPCQIHTQHKPRSHVNHVHHIWPLGEGGPNIADNKIVVCPTGHYNIHTLIDLLLKKNGNVSWADLAPYTLNERSYAKLGYMRILRKSM